MLIHPALKFLQLFYLLFRETRNLYRFSLTPSTLTATEKRTHDNVVVFITNVKRPAHYLPKMLFAFFSAL